MKMMLLIDDDKLANLINRKIIKKFIPQAVAYQFYSGWEAIDFLSSVRSSEVSEIVILLDINMPGMNGWDFLDELRKEFSELPIVAHILSSSVDSEDKSRSEKYSMVKSFITKPLSKEKIDRYHIY